MEPSEPPVDLREEAAGRVVSLPFFVVQFELK
jgi:hypothetical protein